MNCEIRTKRLLEKTDLQKNEAAAFETSLTGGYFYTTYFLLLGGAVSGLREEGSG